MKSRYVSLENFLETCSTLIDQYPNLKGFVWLTEYDPTAYRHVDMCSWSGRHGDLANTVHSVGDSYQRGERGTRSFEPGRRQEKNKKNKIVTFKRGKKTSASCTDEEGPLSHTVFPYSAWKTRWSLHELADTSVSDRNIT